MNEKPKADQVMVKVVDTDLVAQDALLLEAQRVMEADGRFVEVECLTAHLVQAKGPKGMIERAASELSPCPFRCAGDGIETPIRNAAGRHV